LNRTTLLVSVVIVAVVLVAYSSGGQPPPAAATRPAPTGEDADREAIRNSARSFTEAFNKGDAKAVAAMWTENGECREPSGESFVGRAAIEKAYAEFFQSNPGAKIEVLVRSIRFPAKDLAVEEGLLRPIGPAREMPTSTSYVTVQVREGGVWKMALSSEAGAGQDRLEDLDWLLGKWTMKVKDGTVTFAFTKDAKKAVVVGTVTRSVTGKAPVSGTMRIALDPETGGIRSWVFEDDGAHSQALWSNDGKSWLLDCRGVLADGTPVSEVLVLQRVAADAISWHAVDRFLDDNHLPDTKPMRLTRISSK
jgi:uncharacterized protein (TIGR02246 family)